MREMEKFKIQITKKIEGNMPKKRHTITYDLKQGQKVVYKGITKNPDRREEQHREEGKRFSHLKPTSRKMTEEGAKRKEAQDLKRYRQSHGGSNPKYNKDSDG